MAEMFDKPRKKFAETGFGKFVMNNVPDIARMADKLITDGKITEVIGMVKDKLTDKAATGDPAAELALREFELKAQQFKLEMQKIYLEEMRLEVEDRKDARAMHIAKGKDPLMWVVACCVLLANGVLLYTGLFRTLTPDQNEIFNRMEGFFMGGALMMLLQFLWGTTRNSMRKTEMLNERNK